MTQITRVAKQLRLNTKLPGITPANLARLAGVPKIAVHKRVSDLRNLEGKTIYSNYRIVNGRRKMFYRMVA